MTMSHVTFVSINYCLKKKVDEAACKRTANQGQEQSASSTPHSSRPGSGNRRSSHSRSPSRIPTQNLWAVLPIAIKTSRHQDTPVNSSIKAVSYRACMDIMDMLLRTNQHTRGHCKMLLWGWHMTFCWALKTTRLLLRIDQPSHMFDTRKILR